MSIQAQGPYANQTTLLSAIGGGGPTPPPTPGANTFSTLNIINIGAGNTPIPSWGINMMPDQNSTAFSNPICFFNARYTSKDTGIPQLQWSDYTSSLNLTTYSASSKVRRQSVSAVMLSTIRLILFFDGRVPI